MNWAVEHLHMMDLVSSIIEPYFIGLNLLSWYCVLLSLSLSLSLTHTHTHTHIIAVRIAAQLNLSKTPRVLYLLMLVHLPQERKSMNFRFLVIILCPWVVKMWPCISEYARHTPCMICPIFKCVKLMETWFPIMFAVKENSMFLNKLHIFLVIRSLSITRDFFF